MFQALVSGYVVCLLAGATFTGPGSVALANSEVSYNLGRPTADSNVTGSVSIEQPRTNAITRLHKYQNEPASIFEVLVKGNPIELGDTAAIFQQTGNWLKGMTVRFQNVSNKPISSLELHVTANNPGKSGNLIDFTLKFGQDPGPNKPEGSGVLAAGQIGELSISDGWYARAARVLKENGHASLDQIRIVDIELGYVYFDDNTAWHAGAFLQPDAGHPGPIPS